MLLLRRNVCIKKNASRSFIWKKKKRFVFRKRIVVNSSKSLTWKKNEFWIVQENAIEEYENNNSIVIENKNSKIV